MPIDNATKQAFSSMQEDFEKARVRGEWPEEGNHPCFITGMRIGTSTFRQKDGQEFPSVTVQFSYQLMEDPTRETPLEWDGAMINLPQNKAQLTDEKSVTRAEIEMERLKGLLTKILGETPANMQLGIERVDDLLNNSEVALTANVRCQYRKAANGNVYKTEYINEILSGPNTP